MLKKIISVLLSAFVFVSVLSGMAICSYADDGQDLYDTEVYNYKVIRSISAAYEKEAWDHYYMSGSAILSFDRDNLTEENIAFLENLAEERENLPQIRSFEDCRWYLWGEDMPITEDESELVFTIESFDNSDFRPYLVPYLLEDQSQVKGNIIFVADGGYTQRVDFRNVISKFTSLGYNCFELARRVAPYGTQDIWLDMQRGIRYLKYYGEEKGIGKLDNLIAGGFSGGSGTVIGCIATAYGDITPDKYDTDYIPDEIDAINSDFDTALCLYGPSELVTENENLPAMFIAGGAKDTLATPERNMELYNSVADKTTAELYIFAETSHGFGTGVPLTESEYWPELADAFMQQIYRNKTDDTADIAGSVEFGKIPYEYTQYQQYIGNGGFGLADTTCAINEDGTKFFLFFEAFGMQNVLAGWVVDGVAIPRYDRTESFSPAANSLFQSADPDAWMPIDDSFRE